MSKDAYFEGRLHIMDLVNESCREVGSWELYVGAPQTPQRGETNTLTAKIVEQS
jgi:hypothetical protein